MGGIFKHIAQLATKLKKQADLSTKDQPTPRQKSNPLDGLLLADVRLLLDLVDVDVSDSRLVAIDDLGELFEGGALGLDVHLEHEGEFEEQPALERVIVSKRSPRSMRVLRLGLTV